MSDVLEEEYRRSCWVCMYKDMCYPYQSIRKVMEDTRHMFHGTPRKSIEVFDVLAEVCNKYVNHFEGEEPET